MPKQESHAPITPKKSSEGSWFPTTHWTSVLLPLHEQSADTRAGLERLFEIYRDPIVRFISHHVRNQSDAEDLAHDFVRRLLQREDLRRVDRDRGRFRSFLSTSIRNYLANHYAALNTRKRRELSNATPIEDLTQQPAELASADREFMRAWWRSTIDEGLRRVRGEWEGVGEGALFADLEQFIWERKPESCIQELSQKYKMTPNALYVRISRLRKRYRDLLRSVVAETVGSPDEVEEEIEFILHESLL